MINEFIKAEKTRISGMLASYNNQVNDITTEMAGIDAKYKALAKAEKEALSASLSVLKDLIKGASKLYAMLEDETPEKDEVKAEEPIPDANEQVVDTLFPENNAPVEEEVKVEEEEEVVDDEPVEEEKELVLTDIKPDDTVFEFEKEETTEEPLEEEEIDEADSNEEWDDIKDQW